MTTVRTVPGTPIAPATQADPAPADKDERLRQSTLAVKLLRRPELGAIGGLVLVVAFFAMTASGTMFTLNGLMTVLNPSAQLGIMAIAAALLMIGGEFDLSIGSMVAFAGLVFGIALLLLHLPLGLAILLTLAVAGSFGALNGQLVIRTRLPSFIVTLAFLFILRGLSLVGLKLATGGSTQMRGFRAATETSLLTPLFSGNAFGGLFRWLAARHLIEQLPDGSPAASGVPIAVVWFVAITALATWCLLRTKFGNWIFASGGDRVYLYYRRRALL